MAYYIPNNIYIDLRSPNLRHNALLQELSYQSIEIQRLRNKVASFDEHESRTAKKKLKKIIESIIQLRREAV